MMSLMGGGLGFPGTLKSIRAEHCSPALFPFTGAVTCRPKRRVRRINMQHLAGNRPSSAYSSFKLIYGSKTWFRWSLRSNRGRCCSKYDSTRCIVVTWSVNPTGFVQDCGVEKNLPGLVIAMWHDGDDTVIYGNHLLITIVHVQEDLTPAQHSQCTDKADCMGAVDTVPDTSAKCPIQMQLQ